MQKFGLTKLVACAALALIGWAPSAMAGSTWSLGSCTQNGSGAGNTLTNCPGVGASSNPTINQAAAFSIGTGATFATAALASYTGGFGVTTTSEVTTSPEHALDNNGATEAVLLSFSSSVILRQLTVGWLSSDSDLSILRYTGTAAPVIAGKTFVQLLGAGWSAVGNYMNTVGSSALPATANINASGFSSSWWLISAFNSSYGGTNSGTVDATPDYVKLLSVAGDKVIGNVPEPASLALVAAALMAALMVNRRRSLKFDAVDRSVRR
jgi:PEP-CTERM motif